MEGNDKKKSGEEMKFNPNDPKHWKDFDPFTKATEYVDGKSEAKINRAKANRIKAETISFREKQKKSHKGLLVGEKNPMYGKNHTEETKEKLSINRKGNKHWFYGKKRPDHALKMTGKPSGKSGKKSSDEVKLKISKATSGKNNPMHGKKHSEETLKKMRQKIICPYCQQEGGKSNMKRWHFDNCKHKGEKK